MTDWLAGGRPGRRLSRVAEKRPAEGVGGAGWAVLSEGHDDPASPVGRVGQVHTAIPGGPTPGEVRLAIRGGTELFLAYCDSPVERGSAVLVVEDLGGRAVRVFPD